VSTAIDNVVGIDTIRLAQAGRAERQAALRQIVQEVVGTTFFGEMLKIARSTAGKSKFGRGGRGEQVFGAQLDQELARCAGQGLRNGLSEAMYNRFAGRV